MSNRTTAVTESLHEYLLQVSLREPDVLARLRAETARLPEARMQIAPEQGQFMALLLQIMGARRVIEVGTFTGYSALAMALALPPDGRLIACDISHEWVDMGRRFWREAGVDDRIETRIGPALDSLQALRGEAEAGHWDFLFVDADKTAYIDYYEASLELLRPGGVVAVDNTLWHGAVADPRDQDEDTEAIRVFNRHVHADERVDLSLVPIGDGLSLARKR